MNSLGLKDIPVKTVGDEYILMTLQALIWQQQGRLQRNPVNSRYASRQQAMKQNMYYMGKI